MGGSSVLDVVGGGYSHLGPPETAMSKKADSPPGILAGTINWSDSVFLHVTSLCGLGFPWYGGWFLRGRKWKLPVILWHGLERPTM